jgi:protein TonB
MLAEPTTANERFKQGSGARTWGAIAVAVILHFTVFLLWPAATPKDLGAAEGPPPIAVVPPPDVPIPEPPELPARPAFPHIDVQAPDDATIAPTVGEKAERLPPPPVRPERDAGPGVLVPMAVPPRLGNIEDVLRDLKRRYPPRLRDAGIEGTVMLWVRVSEEGNVTEARVKEPSGHAAFDEVAVDIAGLMRFSPARNLDRAVPVWAAVPVSFRLR